MTTGWVGDFKKGMAELARVPRVAATKGMRLTAKDAKYILRAQVTGAGLGVKVANTVRADAYPTGAKVSLRPAATIYFKAPQIIQGFNDGSLVRPKGGNLFLALPTKDTPYGRGGGHIKMADAVKRFGEPTIIARGNNRLVFFTVASSKDGLGYRKATKGRAKKGRAASQVLMFILIPQAQLPRKLDIRAGIEQAAGRLKTNIALSWPKDSGGEL